MYFNADVNTMLRFGWTIMRCSLLYAQVIVNALPTHLLLSPIRITSHHTLFLFDRILCQTHFLVFSIASEHYSLKLLTSIALLLEELQHIQHRGGPQSETQLTIAQALGGCVRRANKGRPAISDHSFGMERTSSGRAPAKHDRSPCAPQSLEARALMVWRSQAVHFA